MADIHDYMSAARETDEAIRALDGFEARVDDLSGAAEIAAAVCLAGRAIALAVREAATRFDYVTRDEGRR